MGEGSDGCACWLDGPGGSPNPLILRGFTNNSLAVGVKIPVEGYEAMMTSSAPVEAISAFPKARKCS
jgi:hypothetical protein